MSTYNCRGAINGIIVQNNPVNRIDPSGLLGPHTGSNNTPNPGPGNVLTWVNAMWHYTFGDGPLHVPIEEIYPENGLKQSDFDSNNKKGIDTNGPSGNVTFECKKGDISAAPDDFDFDPKPWGVRDPNGFPYIKELSTRIGSYIPGSPYPIIFDGTINIQE